MREIKFRAWDKKEKVMCDVALIRIGVGAFLVGNSSREESYEPIDGVMTYTPPSQGGHFCALDDIELMQFTGLLDKNGAEIYEGDIIHMYWHPWLDRVTTVLRGRYGFGHGSPHVFSGFQGLEADGVDLRYAFKVIGNIHQNPELLQC